VMSVVPTETTPSPALACMYRGVPPATGTILRMKLGTGAVTVLTGP
jgi:hypothetical protein